MLGFEPRFPEPQSGVLTTRRHCPCSKAYPLTSLKYICLIFWLTILHAFNRLFVSICVLYENIVACQCGSSWWRLGLFSAIIDVCNIHKLRGDDNLLRNLSVVLLLDFLVAHLFISIDRESHICCVFQVNIVIIIWFYKLWTVVRPILLICI